MTDPSSSPAYQPMTLVKWLIVTLAAIGFAFDIYELLMLPLILPPALGELLPGVAPGSPEFNHWRGLMFWVPAMGGGIFGLLGGYLTDRLGRRRVLTWSILIYAFSAFAAAFSTSMTMLLIFRTTTFIGVCVEFVAAVAWLAELFPIPEQRERALGYTQAFSSIGGFLVGGVFLLTNEWAPHLPAIGIAESLAPLWGEIVGAHAPWRYTLMSGLIPAFPLMVIRPFLPESPLWLQKKQAGTLKRPSLKALFSPALRKTTLVTTILVACSYGAAFGAIQQLPQIVPGLAEVKAEVTSAQKEAEKKLVTLKGKERSREEKQIQRRVEGKTAGQLSLSQEMGGLLGRVLLAFLVVRIVSRRSLLRIFQLPGLLVIPVVFGILAIDNQVLFQVGTWNISLLHVGIFLAGLLTVGQFSFWGNYLPTVYPVHLRGTGESMAANIGGRMIGTSFAALTSELSGLPFIPGNDDPTRLAYTAAGVGFFLFFVGFLVSFWLPEPSAEMLKE